LVAGITTLVSWIAWHLLLNATGASGFDVDAPIIRVSWEDVGSGVLALFATVGLFGLVTECRERASRVVGAAAMAGLVALILDAVVRSGVAEKKLSSATGRQGDRQTCREQEPRTPQLREV